MFGFMRLLPQDHPTIRTCPDRVHDPCARAVLLIYSCHDAVDRLADMCHKFGFDLRKLDLSKMTTHIFLLAQPLAHPPVTKHRAKQNRD